MACIVAAGFSEFGGFDLDPGLADLLFDHQFNGEAVTIPAGDKWGIKSLKILALDDEVFKDLVDRMADMDFAIGIRGAIVEHEQRLPLSGLADLPIKVHGLPLGQLLGFPLGQIALHREISGRKI